MEDNTEVVDGFYEREVRLSEIASLLWYFCQPFETRESITFEYFVNLPEEDQMFWKALVGAGLLFSGKNKKEVQNGTERG